MDRNEAIEVIKKNWPQGRIQLSEALRTLIPEFDDKDERVREDIKYILANTDLSGVNSTFSEMLDLLNMSKHIKWTDDDETRFNDVIWCIGKASESAKSENDMGTCWAAESWLRDLKLKITKSND